MYVFCLVWVSRFLADLAENSSIGYHSNCRLAFCSSSLLKQWGVEAGPCSSFKQLASTLCHGGYGLDVREHVKGMVLFVLSSLPFKFQAGVGAFLLCFLIREGIMVPELIWGGGISHLADTLGRGCVSSRGLHSCIGGGGGNSFFSPPQSGSSTEGTILKYLHLSFERIGFLSDMKS